MELLIVNIPAIVCTITAGVLAFNDREGWGWFLFVAVLIVGYPKTN